jgi:hypothetical protein
MLMMILRKKNRVSRIPRGSSKPCWEFKTRGTCRFGLECKYPHEAGRKQRHSNSTNTPKHGRYDKLRESKPLLQSSPPSPSAVGHFLQMGLNLMDGGGDDGVAQEVIKLLVSDPDMSLIKDVSDRHILEAYKDGSGASFWVTEVKPLFQLLTHPRVVDSDVLQQEVATIFDFLLDVGGSRMTRLFCYITQQIQSWPTSSERMAMIELSLAVLSKVMDCDTTNIVSDDFFKVVTRFSEFLNQVSEPEDGVSRSQALEYLNYIRRRLQIGYEIPLSQNFTQSVTWESFVPTRQSKDGCDHPCLLRCEEPCQEKCHVLLKALHLTLPCGHQLSSAKCWEVQDPASLRCMVRIERIIPACNHKVKARCHVIAAAKYCCTAKCGLIHPGGRRCKSLCSICTIRKGGGVTKQDHDISQPICGRSYSTCSHSCSKTCHDGDQCPPCDEPCEVRCSHSQCSKPCHKLCTPCPEKKCQSSCSHTQCFMQCAAPCDFVPCNRRCTNTLSCGHQCEFSSPSFMYKTSDLLVLADEGPSLCGEICPTSTYCQQCGSGDIKSMCVDFLEGKEYREIDLNEEPCIFPECGHFLTISSMDGQMNMAAHYDLDKNGLPMKICGASKPFSTGATDITICSICSGSVRSIARYGRIARQAMLDEATKKYVTWSRAEYIALADNLLTEQEKLEKSLAAEATRPFRRKAKRTHLTYRVRQLPNFREVAGKERYGPISKIWHNINLYAKKMQKEEQHFQQVANLMKYSNLQHRTELTFRYNETVIQVKGRIFVLELLLKCDIIVLSDFIELRKGGASIQSEVKVDLSAYLRDCANLIKLAHNSVHPREEVQGHIFAAQLYWISRSLGSYTLSKTSNKKGAPNHSEVLRGKGLNHLAQAREVLQKYPVTALLKAEIDAVESMLNGSVHPQVTTEELRVIYKAMAGKFSGMGRWYACQNGHPFIGDSGTPMEQASCPECTAPVGGQNHEALEGVRHAVEIERVMGEINRLRL